MQRDATLDDGTGDNTQRHRIWQSPLLAIFILISGLSLSFYLAQEAAQQSRERMQDRFQATVQQTTRVIQEKIDRFSLLMMAGRGLILNNQFLSSPEINVRWHRMFDSFDVDYGNLGVVGLSFTRFIPAHERDRFVSDFNRYDIRTLKIFPPPKDNQPSLVVMHLVPQNVEGRMLGYDLMSEEKRRQAVLESMRTRQMVLSRPLSLLPTDINSLDYLQILPVRTGEDKATERFLGVVTIGFSMSMLVNSSLADLSTPMRLQLIDTRESLDQPSFDTHPQLGKNNSLLTLTTILNIGKHSLTLRISSLDPRANAAFMRHHDTAILTAGISITLMLTLISMFFIITRQQALHLSQQMAARAEEMYHRYRALFIQSPEAIVVHLDGKVELANQHAARLFGCASPDELYHRPISELVHPCSLEFVKRRRTALIEGSSLDPAEQWLVRTNGHPFLAEVTSSLINYQGHEAIQVVFRDISTEKHQRLDAKMTRIVFEHCQDALLVTDATGRIETVNPAFEALTGYSEKNVIGRTPDLLNAGYHNSDFFYQLWSSITGTGLWHGDIINRTRSGRLYIQETDIHALYNDEQEATHFVCLMRDVTDARNSFEDARAHMFEDPQTRLPNRLHFQATAETALREARDQNHALSLSILKFKPDNAASSHSRNWPISLAEALKPASLNYQVARISDNELALLQSHETARTDQATLRNLIDRQLTYLAGKGTAVKQPKISIGTAQFPRDGHDVDTLILIAQSRADLQNLI